MRTETRAYTDIHTKCVNENNRKVDVYMAKFKEGDKVIVTEEGAITGEVATLNVRRPGYDDLGRGKAWGHSYDSGWLGENQFKLYEEGE